METRVIVGRQIDTGTDPNTGPPMRGVSGSCSHKGKAIKDCPGRGDRIDMERVGAGTIDGEKAEELIGSFHNRHIIIRDETLRSKPWNG